MAFMDRLQTAFTGAVKETLSEENITQGLGDVLKQTIGGAFVDSPAEQIGAQQEILAADDRRRAAIAAAAQAEAERRKFERQETLKSNLIMDREREKRKYEAKQKGFEFARETYINALQKAGENGHDPNSDAMQSLFAQGQSAFGISPSSSASYVKTYTPKPELSPTMQLFDDFTQLKEKGVIQDNNFFGYYRRMKINDSMVQRYLKYVDDFKKESTGSIADDAAFGEGDKSKKKPIPFLEFLQLNASTSKAKEGSFTEAEKARRTFLINFVKRVREGKGSIYDTVRYEEGVGGPQIVGAGLPYIAAIEELKEKFNFDMRTPSAAEASGWNDLRKRKENVDAASETPADKNARYAATVYPGNILKKAEKNVVLDMGPKVTVSKDMKPKNFRVNNPDFEKNEAIKYVNTVRGVLTRLAKVEKYDKTFEEDFGLDEEKFEIFKKYFNLSQDQIKSGAGISEDVAKKLAESGAGILKHTQDRGPIAAILNKVMRPTTISQAQAAQMGVSSEFRTYFDSSLADRYKVLALATGITSPTAMVDPVQKLIDQKQGVRIENSDGHVTIFGNTVRHMSRTGQRYLLNLSTAIQKDPEALELFKELYEYRDKVKDENYFDLKYALVSKVALPTARFKNDKIFTENMLDVFLETARTYATGPKFSGAVATPIRSAAYAATDYLAEDGTKIPKSAEGLAQEVKKTQTGLQNMEQALSKTKTIKTLVGQLVSGSGVPNLSRETSLDNLGNIDVQKLRELQKQPLSGISGAIRDFVTTSKIIVPNIFNVIKGSLSGIAGDRFSDNSKSYNTQLAKGFGIDVLDNDLPFVADNEQFMTEGLDDAIAAESNAINIEYQRMLKRKDTLSQNEIDLHFLRRRILWEKISLTYTLAGYVQGDQAGGRTISNEDFAQVRKALWGSSLSENTPNLINMVRHLDVTLGNAYSQKLGMLQRLEMFGPGAGSLPRSELTDRFKKENLLRDVQLTNIEKRVNSELEQKINTLSTENFSEFVNDINAIKMPFKNVQSKRNDEPYDGFQQQQGRDFITVLNELQYLYANSKRGDGTKIPNFPFPGTDKTFPNEVTSEDIREIFVSQRLVTNFLRNAEDILKTTGGTIPPAYLEAYKRLDPDNANEYRSLRLLYGITDTPVGANYYALSREPLSFLNVAYKLSDIIKTDVTKFKYLNMLKETIEQGDVN